MIVPAQSENLLEAMDPELPFLAARAAIELDNLLLNRGQKLDAVASLAERLRNSSTRITNVQRDKALVDLSTVEILSSSVSATEQFSGSTLQDLAAKASEIAANLQTASERKSADSAIARSRAFCVALSRCASSYTQSVYESGQTEQPWR